MRMDLPNIEDRKLMRMDLPNIEFRVKDALEDRDALLAAPLIVLDTAHDGIFEQRLYDMLGRGPATASSISKW